MKKKSLLSELNRMKQLSGLISENFESNYEDSIEDVDYGDLEFEQNIEFVKKMESIFGPRLEFNASADWGGIPVWSIKGDKFNGYFIIENIDSSDGKSYKIIKRNIGDGHEIEDTTEDIFLAYVTPERFNAESDGTTDELLQKAIEIKNSNESLEEEQNMSFDIPKNKKSINTKLSTKDSIKNALYKILKVENVEGRYTDDHWQGVRNFTTALEEVGASVDLVKSGYDGKGEVSGYESMPTRKIYIYDVSVRNKNGQVITIPFKITCAFVGRTGTMEDEIYELTYYAMV